MRADIAAMRMLIFALLLAGPVAAETVPPPANRFDQWWARQRERESAERFWNGPRETRQNATRDQIERGERDRERGLRRRPGWPY